MHFQNFATPGAVGAVYQYLAIEPSGPSRAGSSTCGRLVAASKNASARIETIELSEQLVEGLLLLVIAAERAGHAAAPQSIEFVNEDNAGGSSSGQFEQISDPRSADPNEHFNEFRAR